MVYHMIIYLMIKGINFTIWYINFLYLRSYWKEYFEELLNPDLTSEELPPVNCNISFPNDFSLIPPDIEEIIRAF